MVELELVCHLQDIVCQGHLQFSRTKTYCKLPQHTQVPHSFSVCGRYALYQHLALIVLVNPSSGFEHKVALK